MKSGSAKGGKEKDKDRDREHRDKEKEKEREKDREGRHAAAGDSGPAPPQGGRERGGSSADPPPSRAKAGGDDDQTPFRTVAQRRQQAQRPPAAAGSPRERDGREREAEPDRPQQLQEHRFPLADFVPDYVQGKERSLWQAAVSNTIRHHSRAPPLQRCKVVVADGQVTVRGPLQRKDARSRLGALCTAKTAPLPERQCFALMNNQNLVEFTKRTEGACVVCRPREEQVVVLGPSDAVERGLRHLSGQPLDPASAGDGQRPGHGDRLVMRVSVLARQHLLAHRAQLVREGRGHLWVDRDSERDGMQDLHIVGYTRDFDFAATERAIRAAEQQYLRQHHHHQLSGSDGRIQHQVPVHALHQVRRHRDSAKLLIAEPLPHHTPGSLPVAACAAAGPAQGTPRAAPCGSPGSSVGAAPAAVGRSPQPSRQQQQQQQQQQRRMRVNIAAAAVTQAHHHHGAQSTDDFPYLTNPLLAGSAPMWSRMRTDPNNMWACNAGVIDLGSISSAVGSTRSSLFPIPSSASSHTAQPVAPQGMEAQAELESAAAEPPESLLLSELGDELDGVSSGVCPSPSSERNRLTPHRLLMHLYFAVKSGAGAPLTQSEKIMLREISAAAGIVPPAPPKGTPPSGPSAVHAGPPALLHESPTGSARSTPQPSEPWNTPGAAPGVVASSSSGVAESPQVHSVRGQHPPLPQQQQQMIKILVNCRGGPSVVEGKHALELPAGVPFAEHRSAILRQLQVPAGDEQSWVFERMDEDFGESVIVRDGEVITHLTRLDLRPAGWQPPQQAA
eukprot:TRINITY_DN16886_c2_g1_i1.p1 TRINITY_DN16886_c2_g1~~TRINITY_DN16886_c2_g1_i1.p1  ORF type:complete len:787 (+),score=208.55 TRINITY_DN16886_c2_g1_i1:90-2450(+)